MKWIAFAAAMAALTTVAAAAAQTPDAAKLQSAYDRLCTGAKPASEATCRAMRLDLVAATGKSGWAGLQVAPGASSNTALKLPGAYVLLVHPDGPAKAAGLKAGELIVGVDDKVTPSAEALLDHLKRTVPGQTITLHVARSQVEPVRVTLAEGAPVQKPFRNAERSSKAGSFLGMHMETYDPIRVGEQLTGMIEVSDGSGDYWGYRTDCFEVTGAPVGQNLMFLVEPNGPEMTARVLEYSCSGQTRVVRQATSTDGSGPIALPFRIRPDRKTYLWVVGRPGPKAYTVTLRDQTSAEYAEWQEDVRRAQLAEQRKAEDRSNLLGALVQGAIIGTVGGDLANQPLMNADGSRPSVLDTLNAAGSQLARQNAEGQAQLQASIARAQAQGERERRQAAAAEVAPQRRPLGAGSSPVPTLRATPATQLKTTQAYLFIGIRPTERNTRNPMCYSTPFQVTYTSEENGWGDQARAETQALSFKSQFEAACRQHGVVEGLVTPIVGNNPNYVLPRITGEDFQVRIP